MSARDTLTWEENAVAAIGGVGITLAMVAGMIIGFGSDDVDLANLLVTAGLALVAVAAALWLVLLRPWEKFDDLQTPYYTGHHHEEHHDEHEEEHAQDTVVTAELDPVEIGGGAEAEAIVAVDAEAAEEIVQLPEVKDEVTNEEIVKIEEAEPVVDTITNESVVEEAVEAPEVAEVVEVDEDAEDDLRIIEGIGKKSEEALKDYGIKTFAAIAAYDPVDLEALVKNELKVRLVGSTATWVRQAKLAAVGDLSELEELQARIKNGYLYDDLTQIKGIGAASQDALYEAKIRAFDELAVASVEDLEAALDAAGVGAKTHIGTWAQQAQFIVNDDLSDLKAFQDSL